MHIPQYAILRFAKHKGGGARALEAHHERQKEKYASNPDVDTARSHTNFHLVRPQASYRQEIDRRIRQAGCRIRKDSTRFVDTLVTASHGFFEGRKPEEVRAYFAHAATFLARRVGRQNIVSAVIHMDEKTPHMHMTFVPLTADNRLSAKEILGNRADLSRWQDDFHAHMVGRYPHFERGEPSRETGRRHIPMRVFKQAVHLEKQAKQVEALLADKSLLGAAQRRENALAILHKIWPQLEGFEAELKKYRRTIEYLRGQNAELAEVAEANRESKMQTRLKIAALESRMRDLERFKAAVPEEVKRQMQAERKAQQRQRGRER